MARTSNVFARVEPEIHTLDEMPMRFRLYDEEPWHSAGLRFFLWIITLCFICLMKSKI